jgi:C4-dicarboxylate-specific signal transduction histidine kinase
MARLPFDSKVAESPTSLRRELVGFFGVLLVGAVLVAAQAIALVLPQLSQPGDALGFIVALVALDLLVVAGLGSWFLRARLVRPMEAMVEDVERIAEGDTSHRVGPVRTAELTAIRDSVNAMADRLVRNQEALAENVASLDRTNAELVAARDEVIQSARLASVGTLASGIAHEVGNPLGALIGFTDVARSRAARAGEDTELLESILEEARRIDRIVRTLLQYARGGSGSESSVRVAEVLDRVRDLLESQGKLEGVHVEWPEPETTGGLTVPGEAQQLEQILVNLVLNALDAMSEARVPDPSIAVRVDAERGTIASLPARREEDPPGLNYLHRRRIALDRETGGPDPLFNAESLVRIAVEDSGPGIAPEHLDRVFDPFFTTKEPGKGTGLGLAICARLAEGMGGRMTVENIPDSGARFLIRLPAVTQEVEA